MPDVVHVPNDATARSTRRLERLAGTIETRFLPYNEKLPWVPHVIAAAGPLIRTYGVTTVISTSPPVGTHLAAMWLKRRYGLHWIADFRDPIVGNPGRPRRWARFYDRILEGSIFGSADAVLTVTDVIRDDCRRRYPRHAKKIHVLWNGFDPEEQMGPAPIPERTYRILAHVGVVYGPRQPTALLASLDRLIDAGRVNPAGIRLRFVGSLQNEESFLSNPNLHSLRAKGCIEICGRTIPRSDALREIATADSLLLLDIADLDQNGYAVPAKLHDYMRAGRPILAVTPKGSPVDRILPKSGIPYSCIYPGDAAEAIDEKLLGFLDLPSTPVSPNDWYLDNFDGQRLTSNVAAILDSLNHT
jgi:glycosyltransferase involved in cell wall biosynthesis